MYSALNLARFLKPYWFWAALAPVLMTVEVTMDLMQPRMVQRIVDQGIIPLDLAVVFQTGVLMVLFAVIGAPGGIFNGYFAEKAALAFAADLREHLFHKVQTFSFRNLDEFETGQLITRLTNDVTQMQDAVVMVLRMLVRAPLLLVGSLIMAILTSPQLAFLPLALIPVELVAVVWIVRKATPMYTVVQQRLDALNEVMQENLAGVRVVKAFTRALHEIKRFGAANNDLTEQSVSAARTVAIMPSFMMLTVNIGITGVLWFGGIQVTHGSMQIGQVIAFVSYLTTTLFALVMVSQLVIQMARAEASARRIEAVINTVPGIADPLAGPQRMGDHRTAAIDRSPTNRGRSPTNRDRSPTNRGRSPTNRGRSPANPGRSPATIGRDISGRVTFENVTFSYDGNGSEPVLRGVSFSAESGQAVALLGTTGAGKSSLVHLIPRFYDVTSGRVCVDGIDVREIPLDTLRRSTGIALQEVVLFSGTIRDNIRYGRPDASEEEVIAAAKAAQAHDFILTFPDGYDTLLGQRGVNLSGGQKQRIAIARALLVRPAILILDDSTSAVDVETEVRIQDALEELMRGRTSFIIAQRISTVLKADKILVLEDGQIAAQGTHRELMATSPIYREIYESQLGSGVQVQ